MRNLYSLFGKSPFDPLKRHIEIVGVCIRLLEEQMHAIQSENYELVEQISKQIAENQQQANTIRREMSQNFKKSLLFAVDKSCLFDAIKLQDQIAERCLDSSTLLTYKKKTVPNLIREPFEQLFSSVNDSFKAAQEVVLELNDLLESSFGGLEAVKVRQMITAVGVLNKKTKENRYRLFCTLLNDESPLNYTDFYIWEKIIRHLSSIGNLSVLLANRFTTALDIK